MKNILAKFKINNYTYFFILICFICGYIKNILIIFSICLIHELGHIFFIKLFNYKIIKVELLPFGGFTTIDKKINSSINKDILIASGGILFQLIFLFIVVMLKDNFNILTYNLVVSYNIILIIFNLIPIVPLDGSKVVHLLLEKIFAYQLSYYLNFFISIFMLIIFFIINYIYKLDNYFIISFLVYKLIEYIKNFKYNKKRFLLERYLYTLDFNKIDNSTTDIKNLRKEVLHYFKEENRYIKENKKIEKSLYNLDR